MKITPKQFALCLLESVDGQPASQAKAVIKNFVELLGKQGRLGQEEKIIEEFGKLWNEKNGLVEAEITSVRGLDKELVKLLKNYIIKSSGAKEAALAEKIDTSLLGGVVIRYGDKVLDGSLKNSLLELKEKLVK
ncbi:MAG: ATP synthase F1 subunit delta [bacterium]|nr:ATP synthase F1 subunit delta [bacterium]